MSGNYFALCMERGPSKPTEDLEGGAARPAVDRSSLGLASPAVPSLAATERLPH